MKIFVFLVLLLALAVGSPARAEPTGVAKRLIERLKMERIPQEGPWFALTYVSADSLDGKTLPPRYRGGDRRAGTAIYALETVEDFSALHRLQTDEIWHFYGGDPLEMLLLYPDGHGEIVILGADVLAGQHPQFVAPRGVWQGSRPLGKGPDAYSFFGDTLAPGFDYGDFEIGYRDELQKQYPQFAAQIERLTRAEFAVRPGNAPAPAAAGTPAPEVFAGESVKSLAPTPGLALRELVGRVGRARSEDCSVASFTLEPGCGTGASYNKTSTEVVLVTAGRGKVKFDDRSDAVETGSVVFIPPRARHSVEADAQGRLEFYAICTPAFSPDDYVVDKAK